jgi:hypothetical protein
MAERSKAADLRPATVMCVCSNHTDDKIFIFYFFNVTEDVKICEQCGPICIECSEDHIKWNEYSNHNLN